MDEIKIDNRIVPMSAERCFKYPEAIVCILLNGVGNVQLFIF